jgi:uncharacterized protein (DUF111 family)
MLLMATVDDVSAETVPYIIERVISAGADNMHVVSAITKKNRMEYIVFVDVTKEKLDAVYTLLALEFGTIGVKAIAHEHMMLPFRVETKSMRVKLGENAVERDVRVKYVEKEGRVISLKAEYEDLRALAIALEPSGMRMPFSKIKAMIEAEAYSKILENEHITMTIT